jgi:CheY-like chemotaxis protein
MTEQEKKTEKKRVLFIEDELFVGRLCERVLTNEGYEVDYVQDGRSAVESANKNKYDVCVSDIRLPGLTGIQLFELIKANQPQLALHMIFITGDTMNPTIQQFLQESGMPCLVKPFTPSDLIAAVKEILK